MLKKLFKNIGPGTLVAAAFIGPGTVTLCTLAGVNFGFHLLWAMLLSIIATIFLQEMVARLGIVSQKGLSEILTQEISNPFFKNVTITLIFSAIVIGNASYEAGNIGGGILGLETLFGEFAFSISNVSVNGMSYVIGGVAFLLLYIGSYKFLEKVLVGLVIIMSLSFVVTAIITKPNLIEIFRGMLIPSYPKGSLLTILGLIGTTIVPYNLFLHASLAKEKWQDKTAIAFARKDTIIAVVLGGLVSMAIMISATAIQNTKITNAVDLAVGLTPLFGSFSKYFLSVGLFSAGITSAITAPLAAAYVAKGCFGWNANLKSKKFRSVWMSILATGVLLSSFSLKPILIIQFAQIANGILLPVIVVLVLWIMNKKTVLGNFTNNKVQNSFGFLILIGAVFLGCKGILKVFSLL
jgi:Mn2+/Fe2+ NRAMP family transporter